VKRDVLATAAEELILVRQGQTVVDRFVDETRFGPADRRFWARGLVVDDSLLVNRCFLAYGGDCWRSGVRSLQGRRRRHRWRGDGRGTPGRKEIVGDLVLIRHAPATDFGPEIVAPSGRHDGEMLTRELGRRRKLVLHGAELVECALQLHG
jgi:hypothetical protein